MISDFVPDHMISDFVLLLVKQYKKINKDICKT
jgi:hypothetical protein